MSASYAKLPQIIRDRFGETLCWRECCEIHDRAYYYGGTREEKEAADEVLKKSVAKKLDDDTVGILLGPAIDPT